MRLFFDRRGKRRVNLRPNFGPETAWRITPRTPSIEQRMRHRLSRNICHRSIRQGDALSSDSLYDDLVWFPGLSETISKGFQARVVICGDQCRLEHHVSQSPTASCGGPFPVEGSAVMRDWS
jgi:hypothetical protein